MIDEKYAEIVSRVGLLPGSSWIAQDRSYVLMVLEDTDETFDEPRAWCRVLRISAVDHDVTHETAFYPQLIGLIIRNKLTRVT